MEFRSAIPSSENWSIRLRIDHLQKVGGHKKKFQCCTDSTGEQILHLRAIQGHSEENPVDPSLQDNVLVPDNFFEFIYHVESYFNIHSNIASGLIAGRKNSERDRQTVLFSVVNPLRIITSRKSSILESHDWLLTSKRGRYLKMECIGSILGVLTEWDWHFSKQGQTRSFSTALFRRPALKKWGPWRQKKSFTQKTSKSPRPALMVTLKANWQKDWNSDAAASDSSSQPIQPNQLARLGQSVLLKSRTALDQQTCSRMSRRTTKNWIKQARDNP